MKPMFCSLLLIAHVASSAYAQKQKDPAISWDNTTGTTVTRAQLLASPKLTDKNNICEVKGFSISFFSKGTDVVGPFSNKGNTLDKRELVLLKTLPTPAKIIIEDITAAGRDGAIRSLSNIVLKVTD